jgi:hypothetical protein
MFVQTQVMASMETLIGDSAKMDPLSGPYNSPCPIKVVLGGSYQVLTWSMLWTFEEGSNITKPFIPMQTPNWCTATSSNWVPISFLFGYSLQDAYWSSVAPYYYMSLWPIGSKLAISLPGYSTSVTLNYQMESTRMRCSSLHMHAHAGLLDTTDAELE